MKIVSKDARQRYHGGWKAGTMEIVYEGWTAVTMEIV